MKNKTESNKTAVQKLRERFNERKKNKIISPELIEIFKKRQTSGYTKGTK